MLYLFFGHRIHSTALAPSITTKNVYDPFDDSDDYGRPASPSASTFPAPGDPVFRPMTPPHFRDDWPDENESNNAAGVASATSKIGELDIGSKAAVATASSMAYRQRHSSSGLNVRSVPVDSVGAQNAASAVVTSDMMDIFNSYQN